MRLNQFLARSGLCSRRKADVLIANGRVFINGKPAETGTQVLPEHVVTVDGKPIQSSEPQMYIVYHKPMGLLCSRQDMRGRPLIYDALDIAANVQSIGRLDMHSEGLLLLTDDGHLNDILAAPRNQVPRTYLVWMNGIINEKQISKLKTGQLDLGRGDASLPWKIGNHGIVDGNSRLEVTLHRGINREIRRTLDAIDFKVRRLKRISYGPIQLDTLKRGQTRTLTPAEIAQLRQYETRPSQT